MGMKAKELEGLKEMKRGGNRREQQRREERGAGRRVSTLRLASSKTGINPIIAWKRYEYFCLHPMYATAYYLVRGCVRDLSRNTPTHAHRHLKKKSSCCCRFTARDITGAADPEVYLFPSSSFFFFSKCHTCQQLCERLASMSAPQHLTLKYTHFNPRRA